MKKNRETLEKLSDGQKISLLTNDGFLASPEAAEAGLPHVEIASFEEAAKAEGLFRFSFDAAANSWNTELIGKRAEAAGFGGKGKGNKCADLAACQRKEQHLRHGGDGRPRFGGRSGGRVYVRRFSNGADALPLPLFAG